MSQDLEISKVASPLEKQAGDLSAGTNHDEVQRSKQLKAYMFQIVSSISMVLMQLNVKELSQHFTPSLILGIRGSLLFMFNYWLMSRKNLGFNIRNPETFSLLLKRSIVSSFVVSMYLGSLVYLPLGVANTLFNTGPIMTIFIEAYLLKKSVIHWMHIAFTLTSFTGVVLIVQPQFLFGNERPHENLFSYMVVLMAALLSSFSIIFLHKLGGRCDELVALQYGYITQGLGSYIYYIFSHDRQVSEIAYLQQLDISETLKLLVFMALTVLFSFCTQYTRARSVYLCTPALVQPFSYLTVLLGVLLDTLVFGASYDLLMGLGVVLTSIGLFSKLLIYRCETISAV